MENVYPPVSKSISKVIQLKLEVANHDRENPQNNDKKTRSKTAHLYK